MQLTNDTSVAAFWLIITFQKKQATELAAPQQVEVGTVAIELHGDEESCRMEALQDEKRACLSIEYRKQDALN